MQNCRNTAIALQIAGMAMILTVSASAAQKSVTEVIVHNFATPSKGGNPHSALVRDTRGFLYGTTSIGGASGVGTVFLVAPGGRLQTLYSFKGGSDGSSPSAGVIFDSAGNLYGTTSYGGASGCGTVYKVDSPGEESVLYAFTCGTDGSNPYGGVIRDETGALYGTTAYGGVWGAGTVYKIDPSGRESVIYSFTGEADGNNPYSGLIRDAAGDLYGTTVNGGASNAGAVYKISPSGQETVLYSFSNVGDGFSPYSGVIRDAAGNLYGTTLWGGTAGLGTVYRVDPSGNGTVLHTFTGPDGDGPYGGVISDSFGNLYGTTRSGGASGHGTVFAIDAAGQETVLYSFTALPDGNTPLASPVRDPAGNLYGTTVGGGPSDYGTVYKIGPSGQEAVLHNFVSTDGTYPQAGLLRDAGGNLYGTTVSGGTSNLGTVFKIDLAGLETVLHSFTGGSDGAGPYAGVARDAQGNLYGTTSMGGANNVGTVYKIDTSGQETVLYAFTGGADGGNPYAGVVCDHSGVLYGTTLYGGSNGLGVIYQIVQSGQEIVLHNFADGYFAQGGLTLDSSGNLYGTTKYGGAFGRGTVFRMSTSGQLTVLHSFSGADGYFPTAGVIRDSAGNLYGTTISGGARSVGTVFKVDPTGQETVLHSFDDKDGANPSAGVIRDFAGNLYGTTDDGGAFGGGTVFKLNTAGVETILHNFQGGVDGQDISGGLTGDIFGNLFGTSPEGGAKNGGFVFKISLP